jgi:hypothetical protein
MTDAAGTECAPVRCGGPVLACGDCIDNDEDGLIDAHDPDCFGPCSDSESSFAGRAQPCDNQACFFDFDCGSGNDERCMELVPNGCDCHGCCQVDGAAVSLGSVGANGRPTCRFELLGDDDACQPCTLDPDCENPCDECERCFADEADDCDREPQCGNRACPAGVEPCRPECGFACDDGLACITGCCVDPS